jgi:ribose transport system ATP-binding protein
LDAVRAAISMAESRPLLEARGVSKSFPGVRALDEVSLAVYAGEVHVLLGQNGAGKSTLIKTLCGVYPPDRGELVFNGTPVRMASPADARALGIAVMFQEFSLVPYLNVAQNMFLGRELRGRFPGTVDDRRTHAEARRVLETLGVDLDTRTLVHRLGVAQQQMVEICKALSQKARVLVMDEPTAALSDAEIERLFAMIRTLKRDGVAILYISHRLHEIFEIGDRITVLRDGRKVAGVMPEETTVGDLVRMMVGREVGTSYRARFCDRPGAPVLEARDLQAENGIRRATLTVRAGEIVGLAGLVGSGRTELARAIFGADRVTGGELRVEGRPFHGGPPAAVDARVGLVPEDRKRQGLALSQSVQDNLLVAGLRTMFPDRWYRLATASRAALNLIARLHVSTPSPRQPAKFLSGGNQQKVVIGKWLNTGSKLFIFDEPTRGIDVGAKAEIYGVMEHLVADGAAVLMISSELPEMVSVCDRVYVMRDKTIVGELSRRDLNEENILRLAMHS